MSMQKVFLVSTLGCSEVINGIRYVKKIDNTNGICRQLYDVIPNRGKMVFFAGAPNMYEATDSYAQLTFQSFGLSEIGFHSFSIIDDRFSGSIEDEVDSSDLVFLMGGDPRVQMQFFEQIDLRALLEHYQGVIIGQSAGAINLATSVLCGPECQEEIGREYEWPGLGKTRINIEPHFRVQVEGKEDRLLRNELLKLSYHNPIYALCDGSHIFDNGINPTFHGKIYIIDAGTIKSIRSMI